jgi:enamine deaminase RidA (YjgF/YER057c/UK114 family)
MTEENGLRRIGSGSPFEALAGYCRAVVDDRYVHVSGTVGADPVTREMPSAIEDQVANSIAIIEAALAKAGATLADVVRNRVYITDAGELMAVAKVLGERFGPHPPANTTLVCGIPAPGARVEIEVTARRPDARDG